MTALANHRKAEVEIKTSEKAYVFRLGINEMICLQGRLGLAGKDEALWEVFDNLKSPSVLRTLVHVGLSRAQPDITEDEAGDIITEVGLTEVAGVVMNALVWALPKKKEGTGAAGKGGKADPSPGSGSS